MGDIYVEGEFLVKEVKFLVSGVVGHEVGTGTDVQLLAVCKEVELEGIARGGDAVCSRVVCTIERTIGRAGNIVRAKRSVPCVSRVAVGVSRCGVDPSPVRVEHNLAVDGCAGILSSTFLPGDGGVDLGGISADLLGLDGSKDREKSSVSVHFE